MKKNLFCFGIALIGFGYSTAYGQSTSGEKVPTEIQSIKPADGLPYSFPSEEARTKAVNENVPELKRLITVCTDPVLILKYQELIWKYENAVIAPVTGSITKTK
jgi:hypothetical protein